MKVGIAQMDSTDNKEANLSKSIEMLKPLKDDPPDLIIFPEYQMLLPDFEDKEKMTSNAETPRENFVSSFVELAKQYKTNFLINILEKNAADLKPFNTSLFIDDLGLICGKYRKQHLFDAFSYRESNVYSPGYGKLEPIKTDDFSIGMQICYDLRFPEPARMLRLMDARIISYQAGWFQGEGKLDSWKTLLRARAMENGVFVIGTGQCGDKFIGHSMVISPYGEILKEAGKEEGIFVVDIDLSLVDKYLKEVPVIKGRRLDVYDVGGL